MSKEQERKGFPIPILGVSEATLFGKRQGIRAAGATGDYIKMAEAQGEPTSSARFTSLRALVYDACARHGELPALQTILDEAAVPWSTRMKLYMAYKAALAYSDDNVYAFLDIYVAPPYDKRKRAVLVYWRQLTPAGLAILIKDKGFTPPTLADVRRCWGKLFPESKGNWARGDESRDKVHRTTIIRMGLPLAKDKIGRPSKVKTSR